MGLEKFGHVVKVMTLSSQLGGFPKIAIQKEEVASISFDSLISLDWRVHIKVVQTFENSYLGVKCYM